MAPFGTGENGPPRSPESIESCVFQAVKLPSPPPYGEGWEGAGRVCGRKDSFVASLTACAPLQPLPISPP
jgi:hypothetical protein